MLGHAIKLSQKSKKDMEDFLEYDSYTQIYNSEIDKGLGHVSFYDVVYGLFVEISGQRFFPTLTQSKFSKILPVLKQLNPSLKMNRFNLDAFYKKMIEFHEQLDFYAFVDTIEKLAIQVTDGYEEFEGLG